MTDSKTVGVAGLGLLLTILACGGDPAAPSADPRPGATASGPAAQPDVLPPTVTTPAQMRLVPAEPPIVVRAPAPPKTGNVPALQTSGRSLPFFQSGRLSSAGATSVGNATFTAAPVVDPSGGVPPSGLGQGDFTNIVVGGATYSDTGLASVGAVLEDDTFTEYLVLSAFIESPQPSGVTIGTVVHLVVLATDFAPGGSVALDGQDRIALFARGDIASAQPQEVAAAFTGTVTFSSGGLQVGDLVTASVVGDFAEVSWAQPPPPPPPPPGAPLAAGAYDVTVVPATHVHCEGSLAGQEAAFAQTTAASLGFTSGQVTLAAPSTGTYEVSGPPISAAYGTSSLTLGTAPDTPPGMYFAFTNQAGGGPAGTQMAGRYFMLDANQANASGVPGAVGAGFLNPAQDGMCTVDFQIELTP